MAEMVRVRVPASTANLGAGFDAVGIALGLHAWITVRTEAGGGDTGEGEGLHRKVRRAFGAAFEAAALRAPEIAVHAQSDIPLGRGLGASASARAAGLVIANRMLGDVLSDAQLLELGSELEGHPDNIAPALFGGCQIVSVDESRPAAADGGEGRVVRIPLPVAPGLSFVAFTPDFRMSTKQGRALLPESLSRADAVHNITRSALATAALSTGSWEALRTAVDDRLHQRPRSALFPEMYEMFAAAEDAGAWAAYLSGGGSTVMALSAPERADAVLAAFESAGLRLGVSGRGRIAAIDGEGAVIEEASE